MPIISEWVDDRIITKSRPFTLVGSAFLSWIPPLILFIPFWRKREHLDFYWVMLLIGSKVVWSNLLRERDILAAARDETPKAVLHSAATLVHMMAIYWGWAVFVACMAIGYGVGR